MGLLDKITGKNDEKQPKKKAAKKTPKKEENVLELAQESPESEKSAPVVLKDDTGRAHHVLKNYHLSEKSNLLSTTGRYVFRINRRANKLEVKKAIEKVYDVHVVSVNIINSKGKTRRTGRIMGRTQNWKKAYVTLKAGEKISGLAEGI